MTLNEIAIKTGVRKTTAQDPRSTGDINGRRRSGSGCTIMTRRSRPARSSETVSRGPALNERTYPLLLVHPDRAGPGHLGGNGLSLASR